MGINGSFVYVALPEGTPRDVTRQIDRFWRRDGFAATRRTKIALDAWQRDDRLFGVAVSPVVAGWCAVLQSDRSADVPLARQLSRTLRTTVVVESIYDIVNQSSRRTLVLGLPKPNRARYRRGLDAFPYSEHYYRETSSPFVYLGGRDSAPHSHCAGSRARLHATFVYVRAERPLRVAEAVARHLRARGAELVSKGRKRVDVTAWSADRRLFGISISRSDVGWVAVSCSDPEGAQSLARSLSRVMETFVVVDHVGYGVTQASFSRGRPCAPTRGRRAGLERFSFWEKSYTTATAESIGLVLRDRCERDFTRPAEPRDDDDDDIPF